MSSLKIITYYNSEQFGFRKYLKAYIKVTYTVLSTAISMELFIYCVHRLTFSPYKVGQ